MFRFHCCHREVVLTEGGGEGLIFVPQGNLAVSGDFVGCPNPGWVVVDYYLVGRGQEYRQIPCSMEDSP